MSDGSTAGCPGEASVCNQCHILIQLHTGKRTCRIQHFPHTRTTLWSLVAYHDNISLYNTAGIDCLNGILFAVKHTGRSGMCHHAWINRRALYNAALGCDITKQHGNTAGGRIRMLDILNDIGIHIHSIRNVLCDCLTRYCHQRGVNQLLS